MEGSLPVPRRSTTYPPWYTLPYHPVYMPSYPPWVHRPHQPAVLRGTGNPAESPLTALKHEVA